MDLNQLLNNMNWKKIVGIAVIGFFSLWIAREMIFWMFVHEMHQTYQKFNTQFESDQRTIHDNINEAWNRQKEMQAAMDKKSDEFDAKVTKQLNVAFAFQKEAANKIADGEERIQRAFYELPKKWAKEHQEFVDEALKDDARFQKESDEWMNNADKEDKNRAQLAAVAERKAKVASDKRFNELRHNQSY